jgi:Cdc6-like AAA superfamily ATPase
MMGIINVKIISKGRMGRMREIRLAIPKNILGKVKEILDTALN